MSGSQVGQVLWTCRWSDQVRQEAVAELWLEPRGLRRHDPAGVCDCHEVVDADGVHRERHGRTPRLHGALELAGATQSADEVDAFARSRIADAEQRIQNQVL